MKLKLFFMIALLALVAGGEVSAQVGTLKSPAQITTGWYLIKWVDVGSDTNTDYSNSDVVGKYVRNYATEVTVSGSNYPLYLATAPSTTDEKAASLVYYERKSTSGYGSYGYLRSVNGHYVTQTGAASSYATSYNYINYYSSTSYPDNSIITSANTGDRYSLVPRGKDATPYIGQTAVNKFPMVQFYAIDPSSDLDLQAWSVVIDADNTKLTYSGSDAYGLKSVYNGGTLFLTSGVTPTDNDFSAPNNNGVAPSIAIDATNHIITVSYITKNQVYTINNTNSNRGALIYDSSNPDYVWSSGKSGTFDATAANSQWVIYPTGTADQFFLYNVGAGKFAVNTAVGSGSGNCWKFSDNAAPVTLIYQSEGTYQGKFKIKAANGRASDGTNNAVMSVSNNYTGPIINYDDAGSYFVITKVTGDASTAADAAVAKLVKSQTALTAAPSTSGWYAMQIKTSATDGFVGRYVKTADSEYTYSGRDYPLTFTGPVYIEPSIKDAMYFTYLDVTNNYWQMPNGKYLVNSGSYFPLSSANPAAITMGYDGSGGSYLKGGSYYAVTYKNSSSENYFVGESTTAKFLYLYPINLTTAGLQPWQVTITNGSDAMQLTCTRSDVSGLTSVYNNGYFFLPNNVTPTSSDFSLTGMISCTVDATNHTITADYNPELSITSDEISVIQGNQVTGKGNTMQALLRIKATPFSDFQPTQFSINLSGAAQVNNVKVYSTTSDQIRFAGVTPTLLGTVDSPSDGAVTIGVTSASVSAGTTLYYWITADVKSGATEWETIDASLSSISYTNTYKSTNSLSATTLDLSSIGNPTGEMRIYKSQNTLWTSSKSNAKYYRIPALLKTGTNTLLAFTDDRYANHGDLGGNHKIDVLVKKSTDGGATWGNAVTVAAGDGSTAAGYGYGDAAVAQAANGDIVCIMAAGNTSYGSGMLHIGFSKSTDGGATWSSPIDIYGNTTYLTNNHTFQSTFVSSGHGITTTKANSGRIAFPALGKVSGTTNEYVFYSDDNGATWKFSDNYGYTGADESKLLELNDGKLLMSIRTGGYNSSNVARGYNRTTDTGVENWGTQGTWNDLLANGCNSDLIYYIRSTDPGATRDVMLHSVIKSYDSHRKDLRLYMSFDEGNTWKEAFQLQPGWAAYSSMQVLDNGDLAILFEDGSIGNEDEHDNFDINYVTISSELLAAKIEELDPTPNEVKIAYGTKNHEDYGIVSGNIWTSNASSGVAGLTMEKSEGAFASYNNGSYKELGYYLSNTSSSSTLTLTAPDGYVITGYSAKVRQGQSGDASYTLTSENNATLSPIYGSYTDWEVSGLSNVSTAITVSNTNASNSICFANFVVNLQPAVDYIVVDVSGNEWARERVAYTTNVVADEMPTSLKRAFCSYSYFADANHTTAVSTIDNRTAIYALCAVNAPFTFSTAANPVYYYVYGHEQNDAYNHYLYADGTTLSEFSNVSKPENTYQWAFIGNPYNVKLLNKGTGKYLAANALSAGSNDAEVTSAVTDDATAYPYDEFSLYGFTNGNVTTTNPFSLVLNNSKYTFIEPYKGKLTYHSNINIDDQLRISNWRTANIMVTTNPTFMTAVKVADGTGTNGPSTYGELSESASGNYKKWTSYATSGLAEVEITANGDIAFKESTPWSIKSLTLIPSELNQEETITITAPNGFKIYGYMLRGGNNSSSNTTTVLTSVEKNISVTATGGTGATQATLSVADINQQTTTIQIKSTNSALTNFHATTFLVYVVRDDITLTSGNWYNLSVQRDGDNLRYMELGKVGQPVFGNATDRKTSLSQQWQLVDRGDNTWDIISRQDRSYLTTDDFKTLGSASAFITSDTQPQTGFTLTKVSNSTYLIEQGSHGLHQSDGGYDDANKNYNGNSVISYKGGSTDAGCLFSISEAPTPVDDLTSGWYRIKYHKNYASDPANQDGFFGRYLYNDEQWAQLTSTGTNDFAGFFPIRVQETAAQPDDDDATYYLYIDVDGSGNVQIQSTNGHWVGETGCANYNSPKATTSGHQNSHEMANMRCAFDGNGYSFGQKIGTTDSYLVNYETTATADFTVDWNYSNTDKNSAKVTYHSVPRVWATATNSPSNYSVDRYLVRAIDIDAVGLTPWTAESYAYPKYKDDGTPNDEASVSYENTYQHYAPHVNVPINTGNNESYTRTVYRQGTVFLKNNEAIGTVSTDLLSPYWDETLKVKVVPAAYSQHIFIVEAYADQIREYAATAYNGHGLGYPADNNYYRTPLETINNTSGKEFTKGENVDNYTADDLAMMMSASEALFEEDDVLLPPNGKSFVLVNATEKGDYTLQSGYGAPILMNMTTLAENGDPDDATTSAEEGWNTFVWGANVTKEPNESSNKVNTESMKPSGSAFLTMGSHDPLPLQAFMIGRKIEGGEGDRYTFVNINGDYLAFDNADMSGSYDAAKNYIRVRKLLVSDLANSSETHKTNKQLYGKVYLTGYSTSAGAERVLTVKDVLNTSDYTLPMVDGCDKPRFDEVNNESFSSAFAFAYVGANQTYDNCDYFSENVAVNSSSDTDNPGKFTTLYLPFPVDLPDGVEAYVAQSNHKGDTTQGEDANKDYLTMTKLTEDVLPARTAALLKFPTSFTGTHTFVPAIDMTKAESNASLITKNYFHGRLINHDPAAISVSSTDYPYVYVFSQVDNKLGFYRYTGATLKAGKIYMTGDDLQNTATSKANGFILDFGNGETTSLDNLTIDNLTIGEENDSVYNLQGQRVNTPKRGVYIVKGKKMVIK